RDVRASRRRRRRCRRNARDQVLGPMRSLTRLDASRTLRSQRRRSPFRHRPAPPSCAAPVGAPLPLCAPPFATAFVAARPPLSPLLLPLASLDLAVARAALQAGARS